MQADDSHQSLCQRLKISCTSWLHLLGVFSGDKCGYTAKNSQKAGPRICQRRDLATAFESHISHTCQCFDRCKEDCGNSISLATWQGRHELLCYKQRDKIRHWWAESLARRSSVEINSAPSGCDACGRSPSTTYWYWQCGIRIFKVARPAFPQATTDTCAFRGDPCCTRTCCNQILEQKKILLVMASKPHRHYVTSSMMSQIHLSRGCYS